MATFPLLKGTRLRATKINSCGRPIAGPANYLVTDGFVSVNVTPVMEDREELTQKNAEGKVCVSDTTPATRKYYNIEVELCNVNTGLITLFNGWPQITNFDDIPIGFRDLPNVDGDFGVALEVWTGGRSEDDCPAPTTDEILTTPGSGKKHGYLLIGGTEWTLSDGFNIGAQVSTLKLQGISIAMPQWGKGPWNVQELDADGTPGRLLEPLDDESHFSLLRTGVTPPAATPGDQPCELAIATIFTPPNFYYGGPAGAPAADVAPPQPICGGKAYTVVVTGTGNWVASVGTEPTANIPATALPAAVQSAIEALPSVAVGQVQVVGSAGNYTVTLDPSLGALTADGSGLSGGTVTVTPA
jgi:hypothetical protein